MGSLHCLYFTIEARLYVLTITGFHGLELHAECFCAKLSTEGNGSLCTILADEMAPDNASLKFEVHQCRSVL